MTTREPSDEAVLAARIQRAYPTLNPYQSASLARDLGKIERAQRRHAERQCNGDYDRSPNPKHVATNIELGIEEARVTKRIRSAIDKWCATVGEILCYAKGENAALLSRDEWICRSHANMELEGDPRGAVHLGIMLHRYNDVHGRTVQEVQRELRACAANLRIYDNSP